MNEGQCARVVGALKRLPVLQTSAGRRGVLLRCGADSDVISQIAFDGDTLTFLTLLVQTLGKQPGGGNSHPMVLFLNEVRRMLGIAEQDEIRDIIKHYESGRAPSPGTAGSVVALDHSPYPYLTAFEGENSSVFFGRSEEISKLLRCIFSPAHRITVLFGASGVGKSSLIGAGIIPFLSNERKDVLIVRLLLDHGSPISSLKNAILRAAGRRSESDAISLPLKSLVRLLCPVERPQEIVVISDQFEDFFQVSSHEEQQLFGFEISGAVAQDIPTFRLVIVIRDDYFSKLHRLETLSSAVFQNVYELRSLTARRHIELAITAPAKYYGYDFEPALVEQLVVELSGPNGADLVHLQIVCQRLFENLKPGEGCFTSQLYKSLGGVQGILSDWLKVALSETFRIEEEEWLAKELLKCLVKPSVDGRVARTTLTIGQLERSVALSNRSVQLSSVSRSLRLLERARIVRSRFVVEGAAELHFELTHDAIACEVNRWISREDALCKYISDEIARARGDYVAGGILPVSEKRRLFYEHRGRLVLNEANLRFLLEIALLTGEDYDYWFGRCQKVADLRSLCFQLLRAGPSITMHNLLNIIGKDLREEWAGALDVAVHSRYPAIRRKALRLLSSRDEQWVRTLVGVTAPQEEMIFIPAGEFVMGDDRGFYRDEQPAHRVFVDAFYIDRYPVTNWEYRSFVVSKGHAPPPIWCGSSVPVNMEDHPVVNVTWQDAAAYLKWAGKRLPTEAEWEKAAGWDDQEHRKRRWAWGDEFAACKLNSAESQLGTTTPIGQYSPSGGDSAYGVSDMCGNVLEWTSDWFSKSYYAKSPSKNPRGPRRGQYKAIRGGSWKDYERDCRVLVRFYHGIYDYDPEYCYNNVGFRGVRGVEALGEEAAVNGSDSGGNTKRPL